MSKRLGGWWYEWPLRTPLTVAIEADPTAPVTVGGVLAVDVRAVSTEVECNVSCDEISVLTSPAGSGLHSRRGPGAAYRKSFSVSDGLFY